MIEENNTQEAVQADQSAKEGKTKKLCPVKSFLCERKRIILPILALAVIIAVALPLGKKLLKPAPKAVYQIAVFPYDQKASDPAEDLGSSMKRGDVLVMKKEEEGRKISWSRTERITYLILRMELTEEQARKLVMPDEREIPKKEWSEEEIQRAEEEEERAEEEGREYMPEPKRETIRPRLYYIDLEEEPFNGFRREILLDGQPWEEEVFDWSVVEKKKAVK